MQPTVFNGIFRAVQGYRMNGSPLPGGDIPPSLSEGPRIARWTTVTEMW